MEEVLAKLLENDINITRRTLERDFEVMRHDDRVKYYAPIAYDKARKAFYYGDPSYSTISIHLAGEDVKILREGQSFLQQILELKEFTNTLEKILTQVGGGETGVPGCREEGEELVKSFRDCGETLIKLLRR
jgi:hypothetical protein